MVFRFVTEITVLNFPCFETDVPRNLDTGVVQSGICGDIQAHPDIYFCS